MAQDMLLKVGAALARPPLAHPTYRLPAWRRPWPLALAMVFVLGRRPWSLALAMAFFPVGSKGLALNARPLVPLVILRFSRVGG